MRGRAYGSNAILERHVRILELVYGRARSARRSEGDERSEQGSGWQRLRQPSRDIPEGVDRGWSVQTLRADVRRTRFPAPDLALCTTTAPLPRSRSVRAIRCLPSRTVIGITREPPQISGALSSCARAVKSTTSVDNRPLRPSVPLRATSASHRFCGALPPIRRLQQYRSQRARESTAPERKGR